MLEVYTQSDILFAKVLSTPTLDATSVSSKLFEYMATGRPLVYAGRGVAVEFLSKIGCALTVPPEDCDAIAGVIQHLLKDPLLMRTLGNRGQQFVRRNYHRDQLMENFTYEVKRRFGS